jgi:hypothetical protein
MARLPHGLATPPEQRPDFAFRQIHEPSRAAGASVRLPPGFATLPSSPEERPQFAFRLERRTLEDRAPLGSLL